MDKYVGHTYRNKKVNKLFRLCSWLIISEVIIVSFLDTVVIVDPEGGTPGSSWWGCATPFSKS